METRIIEASELRSWVESRVLYLFEDGASVDFARGYKDFALGLEPDYSSVVGDPFGADDYHGGYALASYEVGDVVMVENEREEIAA